MKPHLSALLAACRSLSIASLCVMLCSCITSGGIRPHETELNPTSLDAGQAIRTTRQDAAWPTGDWWRAWGDPQLDRLVDDATAGNPGLKEAQARIDNARFQAQVAGADELPQVDISGNFARQRFARDTTPAPPGGTTVWNNSVSAGLSYDLDLWGKNRAIRAGALDAVQASVADDRFAVVELQTAVVRAYVQLALQYALLDAYQAVQQQEQQTLDIAQRRLEAGIGSRLEVSQAKTQLTASLTKVQQAQQQLALSRIDIAALAGKGAGYGDTLARPALALSEPIALPASLPVDLIGHRPDIVAQRWRVLATEKGMAAAHAAFYPNIDLLATASLGSAATFGGFFNLLSSDGAGHSLGAAISLPIFDGGRLRGQYGVAVSDRDAAVDAYNAAIVDAMRGVAAQVTSLHALDAQQVSIDATLDAAREAYRLADAGYRSGITEFLNVLAAQNALQEQEERLADVEARRLDAWALLMKELGGGFAATAADRAAMEPDHASRN
ncbi:efflux transporter outer membrane subunit [Paraburkholderia sp. C35]|uniref:efflux transporter outer membrane subunit n=1 Tax=Paraburkholderia sp. C35 TaxID=2126993 RepID=UPI000D695354|nr:efflux transporter outer membrane subunit [Paraburkholderia sp. C35]